VSDCQNTNYSAWQKVGLYSSVQQTAKILLCVIQHTKKYNFM